jgi:hypothetical protein
MRTISAAGVAAITQKLGAEPITIIAVDWVDGKVSLYADRTVESIQGKIVQVSDLDDAMSLAGNASSSQLTVVLDDTDGTLKAILDQHDPHHRPARVYQSFTGLDEQFLLFDGVLMSPITWSERDRTVTLTIVSQLEDQECGFATGDAAVGVVPDVGLNEAWPMVFGHVDENKAVRLQLPVSGTILQPVGVLGGEELMLTAPDEPGIEFVLSAYKTLSQMDFLKQLADTYSSAGISAAMSYTWSGATPVTLDTDLLEAYMGTTDVNAQRAVGQMFQQAAANYTRIFNSYTQQWTRLAVELINTQIEWEANHKMTLANRQIQLDEAHRLGYGTNPVQIHGGEAFPQGSVVANINGCIFYGRMVGDWLHIDSRQSSYLEEVAQGKYNELTNNRTVHPQDITYWRLAPKDSFHSIDPTNLRIAAEKMLDGTVMNGELGYEFTTDTMYADPVYGTALQDILTYGQWRTDAPVTYPNRTWTVLRVLTPAPTSLNATSDLIEGAGDYIQATIPGGKRNQVWDTWSWSARVPASHDGRLWTTLTTQRQTTVVTGNPTTSNYEPILQHLWIAAGASAQITSATPPVYAVSLTPGVVTAVKAMCTVDGIPVLRDVPSYQVSTCQAGPVTATLVTIPVLLSTLSGEHWSDDLYVSFTSTIGPSVTSILQWIIENYSDLAVDAASFAACTVPYPANFALNSTRGVLDVLRDIAFQACCQLTVKNRVVYITYLPQRPTSVDTITESDILAEPGIIVEVTETESLVTKMKVTWSRLPKPDLERVYEKVWNGVTYVDQWVTGNDPGTLNHPAYSLLLRNNVDRYGHHASGYNFYIFNTDAAVEACARFRLNRMSNTWKRVKFTTPLNKLNLETFDAVTLDFQQPYVASTPVLALVETARYDSANNCIHFECLVPVLAGTDVECAFFWGEG